MSDVIPLVYIGDKPVKKDTITGSRLIFPRMKPVPVPTDIAYQLLDFPTVWRQAADLDDVKAEAEAAAKAAAEAAARAEEEAAAMAEAQNFRVGDYDLGNLTSAKLKTIVEAEGLELTLEPGELVGDFRVRVRDALKDKTED
ncbi:hypothetical protein HNR62_001035 [Oceanisphaera litoralis]|uniref:hypothetical protein n=1 Tax=Oceanisphaera litoralis TaxID=225144 RepID=UPI00195AB9C5|nr:hypothetical protein [Oceanisphaera litoralis]MBM7455175.1 hypothetical protein [Oceanisphaera litoralis]